jgi:ACS family hexuronate transporter-like MFS transporter
MLLLMQQTVLDGDRMKFQGTRFRWVICGFLAAAAFLNYLDRQTLALMAGSVQQDLAIDDAGYAALVNSFLVAYMLGGILSGYIVDRVGPRWGMAVFVGWWSLASGLTGLVQNAFQLGAARFALGLGEAGGWIASPKLVREWFPKSERALAIGIYSSAAHFGAAVSPLVITSSLLLLGWRITFLLTGLIGALWVVAWFALYRKTRNPIKAEDLQPTIDTQVVDTSGWRGWMEVARTRGVWGFSFSLALTNPVWFFYLFWFPKYLTDERGLSLEAMAGSAWMVYAAAGIGAVGGGLLSGWLVQRGIAAARARVLAMAMTAVLAPIGAFNALEPAVWISIGLGALIAFLHTSWVTNQTALPVDLYPAHHIGKVLAIGSMFSGLVTIGSTYLVGQLVETLTYRPMFLVIAIAYPLAILAAWFATTGRKPTDGASP